MNRTHSDIEVGERLDMQVEVIAQHAEEYEDGEIHRLVVKDHSGTQFDVVGTEDSDAAETLETDMPYRLSGLLGAVPVTQSNDIPEDCPACGGTLRTGQVADAVGSGLVEAASDLDRDQRIGIVDATTSITRVVERNDLVDDWNPMQNDSLSVHPPDFVCVACRQHYDAHEIRGDADIGNEVEGRLQACMSAPSSASMSSSETLGLAAGGAKDATNFRENVRNGYTPQPEAISDEGLFYDYHFETGARTEADSLFAPRYAAAVSEHPLTGETERYLSVGLDSTLSVDEFERPRLDLVAVLDVSSSMDSAFGAYYYDENGRKHEVENADETKLDAAIQSLCALTEQLHDDDRLGVVLYNHRAHVAKPLRDVGATDMPAIRRHIQEIIAGGGTNLEDGFEAAADMLASDHSDPLTERRMVFMTDMMPNTGETGDSELTRLFADAAADGIHTTFVGMGLDANAELADTLSGIRGANHYFIHSATEFERRLGEEFDYMVTPLVYDLNLELDADGYEVEAVHGSPSTDADADQLMHVGTLFPSAKEDGEARGGVILVRLTRIDQTADLELAASWTERNGEQQRETVSVDMPTEPETFAHDGVRKAITLARYARELRSWARDVHNRADSSTGIDDWLLPDQRGEHERESVPLVVPDKYVEDFADLHTYLLSEMDAVEDDTLQQEVDLLEALHESSPTDEREVTE